MKIALMLRSLGEKGGINVYTINVVSNLLSIDDQNEYIILYKDENQSGAFADYDNAREVVLPAASKMLWDQVTVPRFLAKERVDLLFNPKHTVPLLGKFKKTMVIHGAEQFEVKSAFPLVNRAYTRITTPVYARCSDIVITTTSRGIEDLSRNLNMSADRFRYVYEGAHERFQPLANDVCQPVREKYDLPEKYILFVGGLTPLKNFARITEAFNKLYKKHDYSLVIVGFKRFKFEDELLTADKLVAENRIIFPGFVPDEDLPALYNLAELLIFPSLYEGFGLPALEAMSCGCPVVTSSKGCTQEVSGEAAVLVDPYSVDSICDGMCKVIEDTGLRERMVSKGITRSNEFSWRKTARGILDIFNEILGR